MFEVLNLIHVCSLNMRSTKKSATSKRHPHPSPAHIGAVHTGNPIQMPKSYTIAAISSLYYLLMIQKSTNYPCHPKDACISIRWNKQGKVGFVLCSPTSRVIVVLSGCVGISQQFTFTLNDGNLFLREVCDKAIQRNSMRVCCKDQKWVIRLH